ncbi:hypothetical protein ACOMHN_031546 [Nucella lapillus]
MSGLRTAMPARHRGGGRNERPENSHAGTSQRRGQEKGKKVNLYEPNYTPFGDGRGGIGGCIGEEVLAGRFLVETGEPDAAQLSGLEVSVKKIEDLHQPAPLEEHHPPHICIGEAELKTVHQFTHQACTISSDAKIDREIDNRLTRAESA